MCGGGEGGSFDGRICTCIYTVDSAKLQEGNYELGIVPEDPTFCGNQQEFTANRIITSQWMQARAYRLQRGRGHITLYLEK